MDAQALVSVERTEGGERSRRLCSCAFVPLIGRDGWADSDEEAAGSEHESPIAEPARLPALAAGAWERVIRRPVE